MDIRQYMAKVMRILKEESGKSMTEFSEELEISRSTLQEYLAGTGNPNVTTIEHIARKLGVTPSFLISGALTEEQIYFLENVLSAIRPLDHLSSSKRRRLAELLHEILSLWDEGENDG